MSRYIRKCIVDTQTLQWRGQEPPQEVGRSMKKESLGLDKYFLYKQRPRRSSSPGHYRPPSITRPQIPVRVVTSRASASSSRLSLDVHWPLSPWIVWSAARRPYCTYPKRGASARPNPAYRQRRQHHAISEKCQDIHSSLQDRSRSRTQTCVVDSCSAHIQQDHSATWGSIVLVTMRSLPGLMWSLHFYAGKNVHGFDALPIACFGFEFGCRGIFSHGPVMIMVLNLNMEIVVRKQGLVTELTTMIPA